MKLVYIASPYSHENTHVMKERFEAVRDYTARVMQSDEYVPFSPIVHSHEIANIHNFPKDHEYWLRINSVHMRHCDELWVLMLDGWMESKGVTAEIQFAKSLYIPVRFKCPRRRK